MSFDQGCVDRLTGLENRIRRLEKKSRPKVGRKFLDTTADKLNAMGAGAWDWQDIIKFILREKGLRVISRKAFGQFLQMVLDEPYWNYPEGFTKNCIEYAKDLLGIDVED